MPHTARLPFTSLFIMPCWLFTLLRYSWLALPFLCRFPRVITVVVPVAVTRLVGSLRSHRVYRAFLQFGCYHLITLLPVHVYRYGLAVPALPFPGSYIPYVTCITLPVYTRARLPPPHPTAPHHTLHTLIPYPSSPLHACRVCSSLFIIFPRCWFPFVPLILLFPIFTVVGLHSFPVCCVHFVRYPFAFPHHVPRSYLFGAPTGLRCWFFPLPDVGYLLPVWFGYLFWLTLRWLPRLFNFTHPHCYYHLPTVDYSWFILRRLISPCTRYPVRVYVPAFYLYRYLYVYLPFYVAAAFYHRALFAFPCLLPSPTTRVAFPVRCCHATTFVPLTLPSYAFTPYLRYSSHQFGLFLPLRSFYALRFRSPTQLVPRLLPAFYVGSGYVLGLRWLPQLPLSVPLVRRVLLRCYAFWLILPT